MKNRLYFKQILSSFLILLFISTNYSLAQDCDQATAQISMDANNVEARLLVGGDLWWDGNNGGYIVPKPEPGTPDVAAIFAGGIWMGGFDPGGGLKVAAQTYGTSSGASDYWPGPIDDIGTTTQGTCTDFDRHWSVNAAHIDVQIADWNDNGMIDGDVHGSLLAWPGQDNPDFFDLNGFELPEDHQGGLAPFFDQNANGIYEPMLGDYPDIHDATEAVWWVFNDIGNVHTSTGGDPMGYEIQVLAYSYNSDNPNIDNATFYDYKFISKNVQTLDSCYVGLWVDFDLGCHTDDYIGCDPAQNLAYVYNADAIDGDTNGGCSGTSTYGQEIPIVGVKILQGLTAIENNQAVDRGMSSFMYYNNPSSSPAPPPGTTDPSVGIPIQYYNYLSGSWKDGTKLTHGGDGHDPTSTDYTNYAFSDPPNDPNGWSMCSTNALPSSGRVVIGSGPYASQPGSVNYLCFAVIYAENVQHPCPSLDPLLDAANDVQDLYDGIISDTEELATVKADISLYPNPMIDQSALIFKDLENEVAQISVFSIDGKLVQNYSNISGSSLTIERGDLSPGIYFYKILTEDFKIHSGKFIVQ